jgi:hypothetical protein
MHDVIGDFLGLGTRDLLDPLNFSGFSRTHLTDKFFSIVVGMGLTIILSAKIMADVAMGFAYKFCDIKHWGSP